MSQIEIYTKGYCPYCHRAKALLAEKGAAFTEYEISNDPNGIELMVQRSQRRTVPQIFIGDRHVGGCDDLYALEARGELDTLLQSA